MKNITSVTATLTKAPKENGTLILKRTFNQSDFNGGFVKYWRIMGPLAHPNLNSDISQMWLEEQGYI